MGWRQRDKMASTHSRAAEGLPAVSYFHCMLQQPPTCGWWQSSSAPLAAARRAGAGCAGRAGGSGTAQSCSRGEEGGCDPVETRHPMQQYGVQWHVAQHGSQDWPNTGSSANRASSMQPPHLTAESEWKLCTALYAASLSSASSLRRICRAMEAQRQQKHG